MQSYNKSRIRIFWDWFTDKNKSTQSRVIFLVLTKTECIIAMTKDSVFYQNNVYTLHTIAIEVCFYVYTYENARNMVTDAEAIRPLPKRRYTYPIWGNSALPKENAKSI